MRSRSLVACSVCLITAGAFACSESLFGSEGPGAYDERAEAGVLRGTPAAGEALYRALEPELLARCGGASGACHVTGQYTGNPPPFLKGPDSYRSIKATPGIITADVSASGLIVKGDHAGPRLQEDLKPRVLEWLTAEAQLLDSTRAVSEAHAVVLGENDIDVSPLATGVENVHLKFSATMAGTILSLSNVRLVAPPGSAVHVQHLSFARVPADLNQPETTDPVDSFSNLDINVPGGAETVLPPGGVFFTGWAWNAADKMRIQLTKLEPGVITEAAAPATCANPAQFGAGVGPTLQSCLGCHGNNGNVQGALDLAGLQLMPPDYVQVCANVKNKTDKAAPGDSLIVKKNDGRVAHGGGRSANNGATLKAAIEAAAQAGVF